MAEKNYIMAIDQGTTSSRAIFLTATDKMSVVRKRNFPNIFQNLVG